MLKCRSLFLSLCFTSALSINVNAECNPNDFLVSDVEHIVSSEQLRIAFLMTATSEQFSKADQGGTLSGAYGGAKGSLGFSSAKATAKKEASYIGFSHENATYLNYLSQRLSPTAMKGYSECLKKTKNDQG